MEGIPGFVCAICEEQKDITELYHADVCISCNSVELPVVDVECAGCGTMRKWRGMELLSTCPCLEENKDA